MKNSIIIAIITITIALAALATLLNVSSTQNTILGEETNEELNYYEQLAAQCESKDSIECCMASLNTMQTNEYDLAIEHLCPEGLRVNTLKCKGAYEWCEPIPN